MKRCLFSAQEMKKVSQYINDESNIISSERAIQLDDDFNMAKNLISTENIRDCWSALSHLNRLHDKFHENKPLVREQLSRAVATIKRLDPNRQ